MLRRADVVTCPTPALAGKLAEYNDRVRVVPNCVLMADWDTILPMCKDVTGPVIGWFGTHYHWDNWRQIAGAVDEAVAAVDGHLAILGFPEVVYCFPGRLAARTLVQPAMKWRDFAKMRGFITAFDVGLAWLEDTPFNRCKSPLKALQYGAAGVPIVASRTVYGDLWKYDYTGSRPYITHYGYVARTPGELVKAIVEAVQGTRSDAQKMAAAWQRKVWEHHSYETQYGRWLEIIREVSGE